MPLSLSLSSADGLRWCSVRRLHCCAKAAARLFRSSKALTSGHATKATATRSRACMRYLVVVADDDDVGRRTEEARRQEGPLDARPRKTPHTTPPTHTHMIREGLGKG